MDGWNDRERASRFSLQKKGFCHKVNWGSKDYLEGDPTSSDFRDRRSFPQNDRFECETSRSRSAINLPPVL